MAVGETPILRAPLSFDHLSAISAITQDGQLLIHIQKEANHSTEAVKFLRHLLRRVPVKLLIVWDGAGAFGIGGSVSNSPVTTSSNNTVIQSGRDTIQASGDYVGGDKISVGDVSGTGIAIGRNAQAHVQQGGGDQESFARAFAQIYAAIKARPEDPDVDKDEVTNTVKSIQQEAQKGEQANENKLTRWLRNLTGMAEDIFEVTVAALTGPQAAFATVARKVAAKAKQERE